MPLSEYQKQLALIRTGDAPKTTGPKPKKPLKRQSDKKLAAAKEQKEAGTKPVGKLELDKWFDDIRKEHLGESGFTFCWECGAIVPGLFFRHATSHLLPKKLFLSVATHPLNYMIYGAGCGCHVKTDRVDKFVKMKTWPEAARRIKIMIPLLPFDELKHLSSQLLTALDNTP